MARKATDTPVRGAYHHGDLREALVSAAVAAVEQGGAEALSLRELAVAAGVSSAAPYRHFADRAAVLAAVVCEGYRDMLARHAEAQQGRAAAATKLRRSLQAFLAFARERPGLFQLMYLQAPPSLAADGDVRALELQAYEALTASLATVLPALPPAALRQRMVTLWATVLGHAVLGLRHPLREAMREGLTDAQIDAAVLDAAIGPLG